MLIDMKSIIKSFVRTYPLCCMLFAIEVKVVFSTNDDNNEWKSIVTNRIEHIIRQYNYGVSHVESK